nr:AraC family transcriptional regulator [Mediterraneibacter gnavus]
MKISQIAKEVGFSNNSYFCRSFREYFGSTPESCRKGSMSDEEASLSVS